MPIKEANPHDDPLELHFAFTAATDSDTRSKLTELASSILAREAAAEADRRKELRRKMATARFGSSWDGVSPIDVNALSPALRAQFEANFASRAMTYGFANPAAAREWFRNATILQGEPNVMIWVGLRQESGALRSGFGLNTVRD